MLYRVGAEYAAGNTYSLTHIHTPESQYMLCKWLNMEIDTRKELVVVMECTYKLQHLFESEKLATSSRSCSISSTPIQKKKHYIANSRLFIAKWKTVSQSATKKPMHPTSAPNTSNISKLLCGIRANHSTYTQNSVVFYRCFKQRKWSTHVVNLKTQHRQTLKKVSFASGGHAGGVEAATASHKEAGPPASMPKQHGWKTESKEGSNAEVTMVRPAAVAPPAGQTRSQTNATHMAPWALSDVVLSCATVLCWLLYSFQLPIHY
jgi:hypothetical protein